MALLVATGAQAQETGVVAGRILDTQTLGPVAEVVVRLRDTSLSALTDSEGRFELVGAPSGPQILIFEHLAYGEYLRAVVVGADVESRLTVRLTPRPITLAPLVVEAQTELEFRRTSSGHSMNEIHRDEIDQASRIGLNLGQLLGQGGMLGVRVRAGTNGPHSCVEYRSSVTGGGRCNDLSVFLDGVPVTSPAALYSMIPLGDIERLEVLSPGQAGVQFGSDAGWGVLLIETRRGTRPASSSRAGEELLTGFDRLLEARNYPWARVALSSAVGNTVGLGLSMLAADQCFEIRERGVLGVRSQCNFITTMMAGFLAVGLPAFGGSYAAGWAGTTDRSQGRQFPAIVVGTLSVAAGYWLVVQGEGQRSPEAATGGTALLLIGTPTLLTLADRVLRILR